MSSLLYKEENYGQIVVEVSVEVGDLWSCNVFFLWLRGVCMRPLHM